MEKIDLIRILWEELKYQHDLFWRLYFRSVLAVLTLISVQLLYPEQITKSIQNTKIITLFPMLAIIVSLIATRLLISVLKVVRNILTTYRSLLLPELDQDIAKIYNVRAKRSGILVIWSFCIASLLTALLECVMFFGRE